MSEWNQGYYWGFGIATVVQLVANVLLLVFRDWREQRALRETARLQMLARDLEYEVTRRQDKQ